MKIEKWKEKKNHLRILLPCPTWYIPQEKAPKVVRKIAMALGPVFGILRANRTGANPPGGGPSWRTGMSFTLAIPGFFLIIASVIFTFLDYSLSLVLLLLLDFQSMCVLCEENEDRKWMWLSLVLVLEFSGGLDLFS